MYDNSFILMDILVIFKRLVCEDLSNGLEKVPVVVTNVIDDPAIGPEGERVRLSCL